MFLRCNMLINLVEYPTEHNDIAILEEDLSTCKVNLRRSSSIDISLVYLFFTFSSSSSSSSRIFCRHANRVKYRWISIDVRQIDQSITTIKLQRNSRRQPEDDGSKYSFDERRFKSISNNCWLLEKRSSRENAAKCELFPCWIKTKSNSSFIVDFK